MGLAGEGTIGVFPSDQMVMRPAKFRAAVRKAAALARRGASRAPKAPSTGAAKTTARTKRGCHALAFPHGFCCCVFFIGFCLA